MAHFAELDQNNVVLRVLVVANEDTADENQNEIEEIGIEFLQSLLGENTIWKQTSYNNRIRKNYAGIGYTYDETRDAFIPPKPFENWILNEETCLWIPPIPEPELTEEQKENNYFYEWDQETYEETGNGWILLQIEPLS
tara:strand:- start:291 stop:707 length:417 start_codon:yes stop_codon:yes gene_type:complete